MMYMDMGLDGRDRYYYRVAAMNSVGMGDDTPTAWQWP